MASVISSSPRCGRFDGRHRFVDLTIEQVDADEREVRRRVGRLLDEVNHVAGGVERRDAEPMRIRHLLEQDLRRRRMVALALGVERVHERLEILFQQVVAEIHDEVVVAQEVAGDEDAVRQAERFVLRE